MTDTSLNLVAFIDDDEAIRSSMGQALRLAELEPLVFANAQSALAVIDAGFRGVVVTDLRMPKLDGIELNRRLRAIDPDIPVILITGHGDIEDAVTALKAGAFDFISKPFATERLVASIRRALHHRALTLDHRRLQLDTAPPDTDVPILGETPTISTLRSLIRQIAEADVNVLIEGESGVGKEYVARVLHRSSRRRRAMFTRVDCSALQDADIGPELFGDSGRVGGRQRTGLIEAANGGCLFLHDVELASPALQAAIARVIEERSFRPLGATGSRPVSFRAISASTADLSSLVAKGDFRADLFYGLSMVRIRIPPLRERRKDIPLLFAHFQSEAARRFARPAPNLTDRVRSHLLDHDWPGNLRELQLFAERVVLGLENFATDQSENQASSLPQRVNDFEASIIRDTLRATEGDVRATIELLQIPRKTFYDKVKRYGIALDAFRIGKN